MTLDEYMKRLRNDVDKFEADMKDYQELDPLDGGIPEDMDESEWDDQYLTTMGLLY